MDNESRERRRSPESPASHVDAFLGTLWGLSPKVLVLTEQEASHNSPALTERFMEALFNCLQAVAACGSVERWLLG
jgi:hypothetical protein